MAKHTAWALALLVASAVGPTGAQTSDPVNTPGTRPYCDARWTALRSATPPPSQTYRQFLDTCLARCPTNGKGYPVNIYESRSRHACDVRWQEMLISNSQGTETYDHYIQRCAKRCAPPYAIIAPLVALGLIAGVAASSHGGDHPASP